MPIRFNTVQDLFAAFPKAEEDTGLAASDTPCATLIDELIGKRRWGPAIAFCAYLLPRRTAVAWGCRSLRRVLTVNEAEQDRALAFAEAWVETPEELQRRKALALGNQSDPRAATTWLAFGAGWSGGSVVPAEIGHVAAKAEQTPRAIWVAHSIALSQLSGASMNGHVTAWLEDAMRRATGDTGERSSQ